MNKLVWDSHSCVPLSKNTNLSCLKEHQDNGVNYISINVGMDMNPLSQVIEIIASFTKQINKSNFMLLVDDFSDIKLAQSQNKLAVSFDLEGANCCNDNPDMIYLLHKLNVRQIHFAYNRNNSLGGGCHDIDKGLTSLGKKFVDAVNDCGIFMDVSHTGYKTSMDIFEYSNKPVIYSHANPYSLVSHNRNITNEQIDACVKTGGVICANGVGRFLGDTDLKPSTLANHIDYLVQRVGAENVGIGLDYCWNAGEDDMPDNFDASYWWPKSEGYDNGLSMNYSPSSTFVEIPKELAKKGYSEIDINKIMGLNMYNLAKEIWSK